VDAVKFALRVAIDDSSQRARNFGNASAVDWNDRRVDVFADVDAALLGKSRVDFSDDSLDLVEPLRKANENDVHILGRIVFPPDSDLVEMSVLIASPGPGPVPPLAGLGMLAPVALADIFVSSVSISVGRSMS
jgi:hypothetical protein